MLKITGILTLVVCSALSFAGSPNDTTVPPPQSSPGSAIIHVPDDFPTIQEALDAASEGDQVLVDPGTYVESLDFGQKDVALHSTGGASQTIIQGSGGYEQSVVKIGPGGELVGFTIRAGGTHRLERGFR